MTELQYTTELIELRKKQEKERSELAKKYALANNPYKIGDIVTDHYHSIKIEVISFFIGTNKLPSYIYKGKDVNKKGIELKRQSGNPVYQVNIITEP